MNYEAIMEVDNLTLEDFAKIYKVEDMCAIIHDGRFVNFEKEK